MLSRVADSLFWLARYIERAEETARILDVNDHMMLEQSYQSARLRWDPLVVMAGEEQRFRQFYSTATSETVFEFLAFRSALDGDGREQLQEAASKPSELSPSERFQQREQQQQ